MRSALSGLIALGLLCAAGTGPAPVQAGGGTGKPGPIILSFGAKAAPEILVHFTPGQLDNRFLAYDSGFRGGVNVAVGDVNGDAVSDLIVGPGPGSEPHVRVFNGTTLGSPTPQIEFQFQPFGGFTGGVRVAAGDVNGDGRADIITAPQTGTPRVCIFDLTNPSNPIVIGPDVLGNFGNGVHVAGGDLSGDGFADIIVGAGPGAGPHVRVFSGQDGAELGGFTPFQPNFRGGVRVAVGDVNGDGQADLITAAGPGNTRGVPHVKVFDGTTGALHHQFFPYGRGFKGGVFVAAGDVNADPGLEVLCATGGRRRPELRGFADTGPNAPPVFRALPPIPRRFRGELHVAAPVPNRITPQ